MNWLKRFFPLIIVALAFLWASITIAVRRHDEEPPNTIIIRIGHWQLESGARIAFEQLGKDFAELPEIKKLGNVKIEQEAIPENLYGQWVTSQMMAQQPPDLMEIGLLPQPILLAYQNRYFLPLNTMAAQVNPFNKGTPLEGLQLKETFTDGMRSGYTEELQSYTRVNLSRFTQRIFYNKTLLRKLTGKDAPPTELRAFLRMCAAISRQKMSDGQFYIPISSSNYHNSIWFASMADPLSYSNLFTADYNRDGTVGTDETYAAIASKRMSMEDLPWRGRFDVVKDLTKEFQPGFIGVTRDEALFLFAQQKAVFICTGTWDVNSLIEQAAGKFDVGIVNFPLPAPTDPELGKLMFGPVFDPGRVGFPFGVTRFSKHPEIAKAFLLYLASYKGNTKLNQILGWIPSVIDVPTPAVLADFKPIEKGMYPCGDMSLGGKSLVEWNKAFTEYQSDPNYSYDDLVRNFQPLYRKLGRDDWNEQQRDWRRGILLMEETVGSLRGEALLSENANDPAWLRYRSATTERQVFAEIGHQGMQRMLDFGPDRPVAPYSYLPEAMARARRDAGGKAPGVNP